VTDKAAVPSGRRLRAAMQCDDAVVYIEHEAP
jgi:hypothetical protein